MEREQRGTPAECLAAALARRFGEDVPGAPPIAGLDLLASLAGHASHRSFAATPVDPGVIRLLCAVALSAPTKSDLQQRDIVVVAEPELRRRLAALMSEQAWIANAPHLLVVCGNNRRQRQLHAWRGRRFANDHLDAFFNAATDAAIVLAWLVAASDAAGLGCCPISAIRNRAQEVSDLLALPDHVFPFAGLALGHPAGPPNISLRLPLAATLHTDRFGEADIRAQVEAYDRRRAAIQPYAEQRFAAEDGRAAEYGWSEDKARQYARSERADFGAFVRRKGFELR
ncbi:MAG: NADPH-dependent oxidoreductase [Alphaproteobacteria bacterium]|nr:NADPH-dependent oxidoreductase [Alphaproteobacteria bacterium]